MGVSIMREGNHGTVEACNDIMNFLNSNGFNFSSYGILLGIGNKNGITLFHDILREDICELEIIIGAVAE